MKEVLLIDPSEGFKNFLTDQLTQQQVNVTTAYGDRDSFSKILTSLPNLIIVEAQFGLEDLQDFFKQKLLDPNARNIPIIICGPIIDQKKIVTLTSFGVIKYFTKPIKYDLFFEEISKALKQKFFFDDTKCSLEVHVSDDVIFIEVANGLNREKISILKYKLTDIIDANNIKIPKVILLLTNLEFTFMDAPNIEYLLDSVLSESRILAQNLKVLSFNTFVKQLIRGHKEYSEIQVTNNIENILSTFNMDLSSDDVTDVVSDTLLSHSGNTRVGDFSMHFYHEVESLKKDNASPDRGLRIAIVDNDITTCKALNKTLNAIDATTTLFVTGRPFLEKVKTLEFDVIILELGLKDINGLEILDNLRANNITIPVIVYSSVTRKDIIVQALSKGAKSYLIKPQRADVITQKIMDIVNG